MMSRYCYETELLELKSELRFLAYAVESSFLAAWKEGMNEDEGEDVSHGSGLCFRHVLDRVDRLEKHVLADVL